MVGRDGRSVLKGTKRDTLELLLGGERTPTEIADALGVSVQTASRNLKQLVEMDYAEKAPPDERKSDNRRGYKPYRAVEFAHVFASFEGTLLDRTLEMDADKRVLLSIWKIQQAEFHPVLTSYLFTPLDEFEYEHVRAMAVYGSVARGDAKPDSDVDLLVVCDDEVDTDDIYSTTISWSAGQGTFRDERVISEEWVTATEFSEGLNAGSRFLRNVLRESIVLYDPEDLIHDAR